MSETHGKCECWHALKDPGLKFGICLPHLTFRLFEVRSIEYNCCIFQSLSGKVSIANVDFTSIVKFDAYFLVFTKIFAKHFFQLKGSTAVPSPKITENHDFSRQHLLAPEA